jgi:hypothetical protein
MLASDPVSILNQNRPDLGIPNRSNPKESDSNEWLMYVAIQYYTHLWTVEIVKYIGPFKCCAKNFIGDMSIYFRGGNA